MDEFDLPELQRRSHSTFRVRCFGYLTSNQHGVLQTHQANGELTPILVTLNVTHYARERVHDPYYGWQQIAISPVTGKDILDRDS